MTPPAPHRPRRAPTRPRRAIAPPAPPTALLMLADATADHAGRGSVGERLAEIAAPPALCRACRRERGEPPLAVMTTAHCDAHIARLRLLWEQNGWARRLGADSVILTEIGDAYYAVEYSARILAHALGLTPDVWRERHDAGGLWDAPPADGPGGRVARPPMIDRLVVYVRLPTPAVAPAAARLRALGYPVYCSHLPPAADGETFARLRRCQTVHPAHLAPALGAGPVGRDAG